MGGDDARPPQGPNRGKGSMSKDGDQALLLVRKRKEGRKEKEGFGAREMFARPQKKTLLCRAPSFVSSRTPIFGL
jgi:hypothetical protein